MTARSILERNALENERAAISAGRAEMHPGESSLQAINRLEDERGGIWARGIATQRQADRLAEINLALSGIWSMRREERALELRTRQERLLAASTSKRIRSASWQVDPWAKELA